ncbi:flavodoxin domain-containing protein [Bacillus marinisedimentorum]|uniref:flavodoxin domain-containing protein n=1 Tax=Bacillus marinisedimentorum TaxID=1821260 RepID=UPI00087348F6|nr:flavodoxin domain-containing protein [Bacillus marinisedimentorum]
MKTLVLFKNKYGDIERYAEWLGEAAAADVKAIEQAGSEELKKYDTIIFGTCCTGSKLPGCDFIMRNWSRVRMKNVIIFAVSNLPLNQEQVCHLYQEMFPERMAEKIAFYPLPGERRYEMLDWKDKARYRFTQLKNAVGGIKPQDTAGKNGDISRDMLKPLLTEITDRTGQF